MHRALPTAVAHRILNALFSSGYRAKVRGWRDNVVPFLSGKTGGAKIPNFVLFPGGGGGAYAFSPNLEEELHIHFHIDHDYAPGTALFPHIHWMPSTAGAGVVRWGIEYRYARGHQQESLNDAQTIYLEQATGSQLEFHNIAEVANPGLLIPDLEPDTLIFCRVFRDATHPNDTYGAAAYGLMADLHYQTDRVATVGKRPNFDMPDEGS